VHDKADTDPFRRSTSGETRNSTALVQRAIGFLDYSSEPALLKKAIARSSLLGWARTP
jgi:hypothetical protein